MVVFPAVSALISLLCAVLTARDAYARPRPDKIAWAVAFVLFAVAAGAEVVASLGSWNVALARIYYLTGAVLVVGYLALGELYLLAGDRIRRVAPGAMLLLTTVAATLVLDAEIDRAKLKHDGWEALERGAALTALTIGINSLGTAVIVGGLVYSAWRFKQRGLQRERMIGCLLIALGTLTVATGGTLARLGQRELLYVPMAAGVAIIFAGYLKTRQAPAPAQTARSDPAAGRVPLRLLAARSAIPSNGHRREPVPDSANDGLAFIERILGDLDEAGLSELCRQWSAGRGNADAMTRQEARRAWQLRMRLSPESQARFDALPVPVKLQLITLYHEVMTPGPESAVKTP